MSNTKNIKLRRPTTNPTLRNILHGLHLGASVEVVSKDVVRMAGSLSRTTKRMDGTRFATRATSTGTYKVTRVLAGKTPVVDVASIDRVDSIIKQINLLKEELRRELVNL